MPYTLSTDGSVLTLGSPISGKYTLSSLLPDNSSNNPFVGNVYRSTDTTDPTAYTQNFLKFITDNIVCYSNTNYVYKVHNSEELYLYNINDVNSRVYALTYALTENNTQLEIHGSFTGYYAKADE